MARIRFYPEDNNLHPSDHIVGTDEVSGDGATRVFTIQALQDYLTNALGIEVPEAVAAGVIPVGDGNGGYSASTILQKQTTQDGFSLSGLSGEVILSTTTLGQKFLCIAFDVPGGFSVSPETLEGSTFSGIIGGSGFTGTVDSFTQQQGGDYFFNVTTTQPVGSGIELIVESIDFDGTFTISSTCIGGSTVNVGDLEIGGSITVDNVSVNLRNIATNTDSISVAQEDITILTDTKADATDLHEAVTIPDPSPAVQGVAASAITGINIDPVTQVLSVTRGTVPVIIGGDQGVSGIDVSGNLTESLSFDNSGDVAFIASPSGTSTSITGSVNPAFLSGVESRLTSLEDLDDSLTVGTSTNVTNISIGNGLSAVPGGTGVVTLTAGTIYFNVDDYTSPALDPFDPTNSLLPSVINEGITAVLPASVTIGSNIYQDGVWLYAPNSTDLGGLEVAQTNWYRIADLGGAQQFSNPVPTYAAFANVSDFGGSNSDLIVITTGDAAGLYQYIGSGDIDSASSYTLISGRGEQADVYFDDLVTPIESDILGIQFITGDGSSSQDSLDVTAGVSNDIVNVRIPTNDRTDIKFGTTTPNVSVLSIENGTDVYDPSSDITDQIVEFDVTGDSTESILTASIDLSGVEPQIDHGNSLPLVSDAGNFNDRLFILEQVSQGRDPGLYRFILDTVTPADSTWVPVANVADATGIGYLPQDDTVSVFLGPGDITKARVGGALYLNSTDQEIEVEIAADFDFEGAGLDPIGNDTNTTYTFDTDASTRTASNLDVDFVATPTTITTDDVIEVTASVDLSQGVASTSQLEWNDTDGYRIKTGGVGSAELLETAVTAGTYGSATSIPSFTVDADGRITSASNAGTTLQTISTTAPITGVQDADGGINIGLGVDNDTIVVDSNVIEVGDGSITAAKLDTVNTPTDFSTVRYELELNAQGRLAWVEYAAEGIPGQGIDIDSATNIVSVDLSNNSGLAFTNTSNTGQLAIDIGGTTNGLIAGLDINTSPTTGGLRIEPQGIQAGHIDDNAVITRTILDLAVETGKIDNLAVTEGKIAALAVTTGKIAGDAVTEAKIADNAVGNEHLQDNAVDLAEIDATGDAADRVLAINSAGTGLVWVAQSGGIGKYVDDLSPTSGVISITATAHGLDTTNTNANPLCYTVQVYSIESGSVSQVIPQDVSVSTTLSTLGNVTITFPDNAAVNAMAFRIIITG